MIIGGGGAGGGGERTGGTGQKSGDLRDTQSPKISKFVCGI